MNALIDKIFVFFRRFKKLIKIIDKKVTVKTVVKSVAGALVLSLAIIAIPVLVIINMFIYAKLSFILTVFLVVIVMGWSFLYYFFYYKLLKNYHDELSEINTKIPQLVESSIVATFFFFLGIIVLATIF